MRDIWERGAHYEAHEIPSDEWFYTQCAVHFGWTPTQTDEQPAALVEWMLRLREEHAAAERAVSERESKK